MPENAVAGNYTLHVDGSANGEYGSYIFQNETQLMFNPKHVSVFITTDKRIYYKRKTSECSACGIIFYIAIIKLMQRYCYVRMVSIHVHRPVVE